MLLCILIMKPCCKTFTVYCKLQAVAIQHLYSCNTVNTSTYHARAIVVLIARAVSIWHYKAKYGETTLHFPWPPVYRIILLEYHAAGFIDIVLVSLLEPFCFMHILINALSVLKFCVEMCKFMALILFLSKSKPNIARIAIFAFGIDCVWRKSCKACSSCDESVHVKNVRTTQFPRSTTHARPPF